MDEKVQGFSLTLEQQFAVEASQKRFMEAAMPKSDVVAPTPTELEVLQLIAEGLQNPAIAQRRNRNVRTIEKQVNALFSKANVAPRDRYSLVQWGIANGYVQPKRDPDALKYQVIKAFLIEQGMEKAVRKFEAKIDEFFGIKEEARS